MEEGCVCFGEEVFQILSLIKGNIRGVHRGAHLVEEELRFILAQDLGEGFTYLELATRKAGYEVLHAEIC